MRRDDQRQAVKNIPLEQLKPFKNHPFQVRDDEEFRRLVESIEIHGVIHPAVARQIGEDCYELISGHRRKAACEVLGYSEMPVLVRSMTDDEAVVNMVDANLQRETILPSERAFAYKMKLVAMSHQGRKGFTSAQLGRKCVGKESRELIAEQVGQSRNQISRYIRLTELIPEILEMVDNRKMALNPAVSISYLDKKQQRLLYKVMVVAKELTRLGRKNGVGKVKWDAGKVSKIIKRKNYLGYTVYCQSYSNNYLEQKRIKRDESEFVYVKGGFPQIISEEQYERCNAIRRSRTKRLTDEKGRTRSFGIQQAQNVWGRKMRCRCGSPMLRHRWRTNNAGKPIYGYECKRHHDTPRIRLQNEQGNPTPICEIKPVGQSKLELMASQIFERVWGDQREIVLQTCKMLDACYKPDADRRADLMKAKDDSVQLLQQQLDDLVVVRARGEIEQDKFLQRTIEIQQQMEALRQSKAQIASEDYNPGRLDMEAIEAALCEAVEMHDGLVSEDFIDLFVSQVTPLSDSRFAWCLDFSPQPTVAFLNLAGQRKYTNCSMDSKLHFGPFADEEGHTIPFPGSLRR